MTIKEEIVSEIDTLSEASLIEVKEFVLKISSRNRKPSLMERLRKIKIDGPPDFSRHLDLYMNGEKSLDDYFRKRDDNGDIR